MKFFNYAWNLCYITGKKIIIALFHLIFITLFCTLPHELGHAAAANLFSHGVKYIRFTFISDSPTTFSFNALGQKIKLGKIPLVFGYTRYDITQRLS